MKKIFAWVLIVFCSLLLLCFLIGGLSIIFSDRFSINEEDKTFIKVFQTIIGLTIPSVFCFMGINYAIKQLRKGKPIKTFTFHENMDITFSGKIEFKDYLMLSYSQLYRNPLLGGFTFFGICFVILVMSKSVPVNSFFYSFFIGFGVMVVPLSLYFQVKKIYNTNKILNETLQYTLNNEGISINGPSIHSTLLWNHFIKVKEARNFILFYQDDIIATIVDKKMLTKENLSLLKRFIMSMPVPKEGFQVIS